MYFRFRPFIFLLMHFPVNGNFESKINGFYGAVSLESNSGFAHILWKEEAFFFALHFRGLHRIQMRMMKPWLFIATCMHKQI